MTTDDTISLFRGSIMKDKSYLLSSVCNALEILDLLAKEPVLGVAEISQRLGINKTSIFRYLYTLEASGYVFKSGDAKYMLGKKFVYMGSIVEERQTEFSLAKPELITLRDKLNETVHLSILLPDKNLMFIDKVSGTQTMQMRSQIGYQMPAYCSGSGKVLLAGLLEMGGENEIRNIKLDRKTENTITDTDQLLISLRNIIENGYGVEDGEAEEGLSCIAVPIKNRQGYTVAAVSVSGLTVSFQKKKEEYVLALKETSARVEKVMGM